MATDIIRIQMKITILEEYGTRVLSTGITKFVMPVFDCMKDEIITISSFEKDKMAKLQIQKSYKLKNVDLHPIFGVQITKRTIILETQTEAHEKVAEFLNPPEVTSLVGLRKYQRISLKGTVSDITDKSERLTTVILDNNVTVKFWDGIHSIPEKSSTIKLISVEVNNASTSRVVLHTTRSTKIEIIEAPKQEAFINAKIESVSFENNLIELNDVVYDIDPVMLKNILKNIYEPIKVTGFAVGGVIRELTTDQEPKLKNKKK